MKRRNHNMLSINGEKLRAILKDKELNSAGICRELGYSSHYLLNCCDAGHLRPFFADYLASNYGISPDEYVVPEVQEPITPPGEPIPDLFTAARTEPDERYPSTISVSELEELITRAVCKGIQLYDRS